MGIFDHVFGRDARKDLAKAESLLDQGNATKALRLVERCLNSDDQLHRERALTLQQRAAHALYSHADSSATASANDGFFDDAAEWLRTTRDLPLDTTLAAEIEGRIRQYEEAVKKAESREIRFREQAIEPSLPAVDTDSQPALAIDDSYDLLLGTLDEDLLEYYEYQGEDFRQAYVDLNEGRVEAAAPIFERLAHRFSKDPAIRFERGRCRLALGDREGATQDFERVWTVFGDEAVDRGGRISVPALWAEAMLGLGRHTELLERLDGVADPRFGDPELCHLFARALSSAGQFDRAREFLTLSASTFPAEPVFNRLLALVYVELGERERAVAGLESAIAPACSGGCGAPQLDPATLQTLIRLYLDEPVPAALQRVRELLEHLSHSRSGRPNAEDLLLLIQYHRAAGDDEAATDVTRKLEAFEELVADTTQATNPAPLMPAKRAAL